jgi:YegS/Rv2252/BmrU family lipid kinase
MRLLVIVNLHASRAEESVGSALGSLISNGFDLDIRATKDRDASLQSIRDGGPSVDAIVVAGGDGTLNGVLPALIEQRKPIGILPMGTANDLASTLGIPFDPVAAAGVIAAGNKRKVDIGRVNDAHFLNAASIGLSVQIAERQNEQQKKLFGILSYAFATIATLSEAERFEATIEFADRQEAVNASQIVVGNGVHFGGGMTISPEAGIDDGLLDIYAIETASVPDLIALAPQLRSGTLVGRDDVAYFRSGEALIKTAKPMPINTDGEVTTETPATFSVLRSALEFFAP